MFSSTDTQRRIALAILRVGIGVIFVAHGWQKFHMMGHAGVTGFFTQLGIPMPGISAWLVTALELGGGILLILGAFTRLIALGLAIDMLVAILTYHIHNGFFMGQKPGVEFVLSLMVGALALVVGGPGAASVDEAIATRRATT